MRKTMAKFLSVVCVIALAFSVCTFSVMAEETVLGALTAEKLAVSNGVNQLPTCIVNNLTLPEIDGVTWSSSNPAVLAADGTVTRPVEEDANVTLTATAGEETKSFNFTVKAYTTEVDYQDSFAYASRDAFVSQNPKNTPWYTSAADTTSVIATDADGNQYVAFDFEENAAYKQTNMSIENNVVYMELDVKGQKDKVIDAAITVTGKNVTDDSAVSYTFYCFRSNGGQLRMPFQSYTENDELLWNKGYSFGACQDTFVHLKIRMDFTKKEIYITGADGIEYGPIPMCAEKWYSTPSNLAPATVRSDAIVFDTVTKFEIKRAGGSTPAGTFSVDNLVLYTEKSVDEALLDAPAEQQFDYIISDLEEKFPLTDNAGITSARTFDLPTYGGIVSWTDANGNTLGESVTLTQNQTTFNTGKLIATIAPAGSEAKTYTYAYSVLPAGTSVRTKNGTYKDLFNFDGDWEAPQTMNSTAHTNMEFKVYGTTGDPVPEGVIWTTEYESDAEVANKVAKFVNHTTPADENDKAVQQVSLTQGGVGQANMRMQIGTDFKLVEGDEVSITVTGPDKGVVPVTINFENGTITLSERSNDVVKGNNTDFSYTYNLADYGVTKDSWNRFEIDYSTVGFLYDIYLNGNKVNSIPMNLCCVNGQGNYWSNTFRFFNVEIPAGSTVLLDNVTVAETADANANALVEGTMRRIEKNFAVDSAFANGDTLYNDLLGKGALPAPAYISSDGVTNNYTDRCKSPAISWKLDGVALAEVDDRVPLSFTGMGTHTLEVTVSSGAVSDTKSFEITGAPVALRVLGTLVPGVKLGSDISGKLIVAQYTDSTMKVLDNVRIYKYTNGVNETGAFVYKDKDYVKPNSRLFFISDNFAPIAFDVAK